MAQVLISIGSNTTEKHNILTQIIETIGQISHIIAHTPIFDTPAEGCSSSTPYANALILASLDENYDILREKFKQWEIDYGRTHQLKQQGIIPLDIDIIMWDNTILKERDMQMNYMKTGLKILNTIISSQIGQ